MSVIFGIKENNRIIIAGDKAVFGNDTRRYSGKG